jgi:hypothetical protein
MAPIVVFTHPRSSEGPSPETSRRRSGEWRPAAAARNQGPGRSGTPPARHNDLAARSSLHKSGRNAGDGSAAPDQKSPRWSAERRARPAGRAPRLSKRGSSRAETRDNGNVRLSALRSPLIGVDGKETSKTRAQQRAAGTKKTALFDIVNRNWRQRARAPAQRAPRRAFLDKRRIPDGAKRNPGVVPRGTTAPHSAELVIGPRFARTRWLHAGYELRAPQRHLGRCAGEGAPAHAHLGPPPALA